MDGIIIINKEKGWTSNDVVQKVKHITKEKVGHTGTLDPLATGVLPLLIGKGTCLSKYLINHDKEYIATIKLGQKTDTADSEGTLIEEKEVNQEIFQKENIKNILKSFIGAQSQIPPIYSAIKLNGKKLYEYAREGKTPEIKPRNITIYDMDLIGFSAEDKEIKYRVKCSKGTYIRTLSEDIACSLGTVGFMKELERVQVGEFFIEQAIKISEVQEKFEEYFITIDKFFANNEEVILNFKQLSRLYNGVKLSIDKEDGIFRVCDENGQFVCVGVVENQKLKRDIWIKEQF